MPPITVGVSNPNQQLIVSFYGPPDKIDPTRKHHAWARDDPRKCHPRFVMLIHLKFSQSETKTRPMLGVLLTSFFRFCDLFGCCFFCSKLPFQGFVVTSIWVIKKFAPKLNKPPQKNKQNITLKL